MANEPKPSVAEKLLQIRVPLHLADDLTYYASQNAETMTAFARRLLADGLAEHARRHSTMTTRRRPRGRSRRAK